MIHFTYQTKNSLNDKTYIGVHSTDNINDGYLGSGKALLKSIAKHGKENFKCIPLCFFDTAEEAYEEEAWLVDKKWVNDRSNYNLTLGGGSGWYHVNSKPSKQKGVPKTKEAVENNRKAQIEWHKHNVNSFKGKKHTEESRDKISKSWRERDLSVYQGENNGMFGKSWDKDKAKAMGKKVSIAMTKMYSLRSQAKFLGTSAYHSKTLLGITKN